MQVWLLLKPRVLSLRNQVRFADRGRRWRSLFMSAMALGFAALLFFLAFRMLAYFKTVEVLGEYLSRYLLQGVLVVFFGLLFFSNVIAGLSRLYLSGDLDLCHAAPVPLEGLFLSRFVLTLVDSSWMLLLFGVPILSAYGLVFDAGAAFYFTLFHMCLAMAIISGGLGVLLTMILVRVFPARRTRDMVLLLTLVMLVALYILVRFLRPERLADPEGFFTLVQYLDHLKGVRSPFFPAHWIAETLWGALRNPTGPGQGFHVFLSWTTAFALIYANVWTACLIYGQGFSRAQEGRKKKVRGRSLDRVFGFVFGQRGRDLAALTVKDVRAFLRDNTQWSQLLLLGGLVIVYVYNFSVLPLDQVPLGGGFLLNEMAFFNMGLAGFVLTALATRFVFPAVSARRRSLLDPPLRPGGPCALPDRQMPLLFLAPGGGGGISGGGHQCPPGCPPVHDGADCGHHVVPDPRHRGVGRRPRGHLPQFQAAERGPGLDGLRRGPLHDGELCVHRVGGRSRALVRPHSFCDGLPQRDHRLDAVVAGGLYLGSDCGDHHIGRVATFEESDICIRSL